LIIKFYRLHQIILMINLCLAFFERPSSFSDTSDVRYKPHRIVFPYFMLMMIEGLSLFWFFLYISTKVRKIKMKKFLFLFLMNLNNN